MDRLIMDSIAQFRRAIAFGLFVRKPGDVTVQHLKNMANAKCRDSARDLIKETYNQLVKAFADDNAIDFFHSLAVEWYPGCKIHETYSLDQLATIQDSIYDNEIVLGKDLANYLSECVGRAKSLYPDTDHPDYDKEAYKPDWLGQSFLLADQKGKGPMKGKSINLENDADALDAIKRIHIAHTESTDTHVSRLEDELERFIEDKLPRCIESLVSVSDGSGRRKLAKQIIKDINVARTTITRPDRANRMAAANIYATCESFDSNAGTPSKHLSSNNKSNNATGRERVFRDKKKHLHPQISRAATDRSEMFRAIEDETVLRSYDYVKEAFKIVSSQDISNSSRTRLSKLQKQTEQIALKRTKHAVDRVWDAIWSEFSENALANCKTAAERE